ncbi:MAG TPA: sigma-70 family RNA polymerase sigma factor [Jiangellaceae bacterium]|nr:sigma-70 family RNA polymerase sigma factor [Jiangellaceae bacterium]
MEGPEGRPTDSADVTDQVAVDRVRAGDRDAYAILVRRHAIAAHRAAFIFGAGQDAEDVVQVAFVKAFQALPRCRDGAAFRPWLLRIVINEAKNAQRATRRRRSATERLAALDVPLDGPDPAVSTLSGERRVELMAAVQRLPEPQQRVIACRYFLDLDERETATALGLPAGTVKSRLHRALRRLQRELSPDVKAAEHER